MKSHRFAELFPLMEEAQIKELAIDIKVNGLRDPIVTFEGQILDGRNRWAACKIAGAEFDFEDYLGDDPLGFVISRNMKRRHLTVEQRTEIAAKIANMTQGHQPNAPFGAFATPSKSGVKKISQAEAAARMSVSRRSVQRAVAKSKPKESPKKPPKKAPGWSTEDLKCDPEIMNAFKVIDAVYGHEDTKAIRLGAVGLKRAEILFLSQLPKEKMLECQGLIMGHGWSPQKALSFLSKMPDASTTLASMQNYCLSTPDKNYNVTVGGFKHVCVKLGEITKP